ncbi:MAG TPA: FmdB family zinc ribbon protein [Bryobacteraceae bacterium]|nr:FmdB family zinc ribbon protein [Bryobacteraceae bacterium]
MALYEYECESCGTVFEVIQKFADEPLSVHAGCGGHVHRLLSAPALRFKGSGWYITDYGKGNNGKADAGPPASSPTSSEGSKAESKPASESSSANSSSTPPASSAKPAKKE